MTNMDDFRRAGKEMIDYVADYMENIRDRNVLPSVVPGFLRPLLPTEAPDHGEDFQDILKDVDRVLMPGVTHWRHPHFFAYYASSASKASILADILTGAIAGNSFSWIANPASTELEMIMMDWLVKLLGLPEHFLFESKGPGGGVIQPTSSESTFVSMLSARARFVKPEKELKHSADDHKARQLSASCAKKTETTTGVSESCAKNTETTTEGSFDKPTHLSANSQQVIEIGQLVAYASKQAHSSVWKAAKLTGVKLRLIDTDEMFSMRGECLRKAIKDDRSNGLIPFHCTATTGSTNSCAFDNLREIGEICEEENIWMHVDAAYAGSAFICAEYRKYIDGVEYADSFCFNPHKWLLVNLSCCAMFVKNSSELVEAFNVDPLYLRHSNEEEIPDYRKWQISLGKPCRSLKVWFTLRLHGKDGLQSHIRDFVSLAKDFEALLCIDNIFEICAPVVMSLVCFRIKGHENELTEKLNKQLFNEGKIYLIPTTLNGVFVLRFTIVSTETTSSDVKFAYEVIKRNALEILNATD